MPPWIYRWSAEGCGSGVEHLSSLRQVVGSNPSIKMKSQYWPGKLSGTSVNQKLNFVTCEAESCELTRATDTVVHICDRFT